MSTRGRSTSPRRADADVDMDATTKDKPNATVVVVTGLTRSVVEDHLKIIFSLYGEITKIDLPHYLKCERSLCAIRSLTYAKTSHSWPK